MKFLVLGATGTVGSQVARELLSRGHQVKALTRNPEKLAGLGAGVEAHKGDLLEPKSLAGLYDGVDGAFIINAVSVTESQEGLTALTAAKLAGLKKIVYLSVQHVDKAPYLPHFGSKLGIEMAIKQSGIPFTILRPSNFHQNEVWFRDVMLKYGVYPQPLGSVGVSRVDVRDIAEAAAIALTQPGHEGKTYNLIGPRAVTGTDTAEIWSKALGRTIAYGGDDLEAWEKGSEPYFPAAVLYDFKHMYGHFQKHGLKGTPEEVATLTQLLGHAPRSLEAYAAETAKVWNEQAASTAV